MFVKGLQGDPASPDFLRGKYVISSTKHFLADGGTDEGRDQGDAKIPETELRDIHNAGYVPAIEAGVQTIMISFSSWNGEKLTGHKGLMTDVLKKRMNFDGFTVGDWNAHGQVKGCTNDNCPQALNAGLDMYMAPDSWRGLYENLRQAGEGRHGSDGAPRRCGHAHPAREIPRRRVRWRGAVQAHAGRATSRCWRRRSSARWRAMRCASRW